MRQSLLHAGRRGVLYRGTERGHAIEVGKTGRQCRTRGGVVEDAEQILHRLHVRSAAIAAGVAGNRLGYPSGTSIRITIDGTLFLIDVSGRPFGKRKILQIQQGALSSLGIKGHQLCPDSETCPMRN